MMSVPVGTEHFTSTSTRHWHLPVPESNPYADKEAASAVTGVNIKMEGLGAI
jgi:hypothetical protein